MTDVTPSRHVRRRAKRFVADGAAERPRVALLTNILPPYRVAFFNELAQRVDLHVVVNALSTPDRSWSVDPRDVRFPLEVEGGLTRRTRRGGAGGVSEVRFQHLAQRTVPVLRRLAPDIVVSAELGLRTAQALWYCRRRGIPCLLFWEGTAHTEARISALRHAWRRGLVRGVSGAWVNGIESRDYLSGLGVPAARIVADMTGVDMQFFREAAALEQAGRGERRARLGLRGVVLAVSGSLSPRKGIPQFLAALDTLAARAAVPEFSVLFIGDGEQRSAVERWAGAHSRVPVHVTGFKQLHELPGYYVCADWCVLPTLEDCWALATVEPMACGLRQVFSRYNGASADLIRYSGAGLLADPLDREQFASVLEEAVRAPPQPLDAAVIEAVTRRYSSQSLAERAARALRATLTPREAPLAA